MKKILKKLIVIFFIISAATISVFAQESSSISYDYGAATNAVINPNPVTADNNTLITLADAECVGFEFVGWYLESDYITPVTSITVTDNITLYAKWYEMSYSIEYVLTTKNIPISAQDVTNSNPHIKYSSEEIILFEPTYISEEYTFEGWYADENYTQKVEILNSSACSDLTLYAHWVCSEFNITYDLGEISNSVYTTENPNEKKYTFGTGLTLLPAETNDPAFNFGGWYTDEFFTQQIEKIDSDISGDITLYAKWNKNVYTVTYVLNSGTSPDISDIENPNDSERTADVDFILSAPITADKSYKFDGWYTTKSFDKNSKITSISANTTKNVTLYAKWTQAVYSISYDYGVIDIKQCPVTNNNPVEYRYEDKITLEDLAADGFIFNGWYTDAEYTEKITDITADMYGDITLYAYFTEKTYTITYILADKEVSETQVSNPNPNVRTTTERFYFDDAETINTDYRFGGWYFDKEFTDKATFIKAYTAENVTVYAKWVKKSSYTPVWGDATLSDELSAADARLILRYSAGLETSFTDVQTKLSDLNNDSKVSAADARIALRIAAKIDSYEQAVEKYSLGEIKLIEGEVTFTEN